jgi:hypothetical protein
MSNHETQAKTLQYHLRAVALLILFWAAALHFLVALPPFEGSDEDKHFGYVTQLRQTGAFPDPRDSLNLPARQASGQAPLYYVAAWAWSALGPAYTWDGRLPMNPYTDQNRPLLTPGNANVFLFGPDQIPYEANPALVPALLWMRLLSPLMGVLAVALTLAAAPLFLSRRGSLLAAMLFAFNPVLVFMFSYVTNDAAAILFGAAMTFALVYMLRRPLTRRGLLLAGAVAGLGALTKANALVFAPLLPLAVLLRTRRVWPALLAALPILLIGAPWYIYNGLVYGDPLGIQPHLRTFWALATPRALGEALRLTLFDNAAYQLRSAWYGVASGVVMDAHWMLGAPLGLMLLSLVGYIRGGRALIRRDGLVLLALLAVCGGIFAAYVRWLMLFDSVTGRLLLPGWAAFALLAAVGLTGLRILKRRGGSMYTPASGGYSDAMPASPIPPPPFPHRNRERGSQKAPIPFSDGVLVTLLTLAGFAALVLVPGATLERFYHKATLPPEEVPPLQGETARYSDAELLGYQLEPARLRPGEVPTATVCWRSLRADARLPATDAVAFHIVGADNTVYARRESLPGLGLYTNWQPERAFCDRFTLQSEHLIQPGHGYRIAIYLFNPETGQQAAEANGKTLVGWVGAPGPALAEARPQYRFDGVYLLHVEWKIDGDALSIQTEWGTGEWQPRPLTFFAHVVDASGELAAQLDTPLGGDEYPAFLWGDHEQTWNTTYRLPLPAQAGAYTLQIGLYDALARLPAADANGTPLPDGIATLGTFQKP